MQDPAAGEIMGPQALFTMPPALHMISSHWSSTYMEIKKQIQ